MPIDTELLATFVTWNLSLKCHEAGRRHRHWIPDEHADRLLIALERCLLDKGETYDLLGVALDDRTYRRARRRVFPEGRNTGPITPIPQRRDRDHRNLPLSCKSLLALYEAAMHRACVPHDFARQVVTELRLAERSYLMVKELMGRVSRQRWSDEDLILVGWTEADTPKSPKLVEIAQSNSSYPGSPARALRTAISVPFAFQPESSTEPVWLPFPSGNFAAQVFRDVALRGDFYSTLVVLCAYSPNPQAFLEAVVASGGVPAKLDELMDADWPFFGVPISIGLEWAYIAVSSDDDCAYLICEASGLPRTFPSKSAANTWLSGELGPMRARVD